MSWARSVSDAAPDFKLASQVNVGNYRLSAIVLGTTTDRTVTVKPYALPKFRVATSLAAPWAKVGSLVTGTVDAAGVRADAVYREWIDGEEDSPRCLVETTLTGAPDLDLLEENAAYTHQVTLTEVDSLPTPSRGRR